MKVIRYFFSELDSTNEWLKNSPLEWPANTLIAVNAATQYAGRGRRGNSWYSSTSSENIYLSFGFDKYIPDNLTHNCGQIAALAALAAIAHSCGIAIKIKWPNDLFYDGKKLGGVLCEVAAHKKLWRLVIGLGINVNISSEELLANNLSATSLKVITRKQWPIEQLLQTLIDYFKRYWLIMHRSGFKPFLPQYQSALVHSINDPIVFKYDGSVVEGIYKGLSEEGYLLLLDQSGTISTWKAGEILC